MSVLCIVQARLGSTRLPGKALLPLNGKPLIQHVMERAQQIQGVDALVLAVPASDVESFRIGNWTVMGFPDVADADVLGRFASVLACYPRADTVMRLTGDCPLLDPVVCAQVLELYRRSGCSYAWNVTDGYVDGEDCEVFSASLLRRAHTEATNPHDREHVSVWMRRHVLVATLPPGADRGALKTSVDTIEDLERVRALVAACR